MTSGNVKRGSVHFMGRDAVAEDTVPLVYC